MKFIKAISLVTMGLSFSGLANAGTLKCTSVGDQLPENRLIIDVTLETNWLGNVISEGSYSYRDAKAKDVSGEGKFACLKPNDKKIIFCGAIDPDQNIKKIVAHPVMGFMMQLSSQSHIALFTCK